MAWGVRRSGQGKGGRGLAERLEEGVLGLCVSGGLAGPCPWLNESAPPLGSCGSLRFHWDPVFMGPLCPLPGPSLSPYTISPKTKQLDWPPS